MKIVSSLLFCAFCCVSCANQQWHTVDTSILDEADEAIERAAEAGKQCQLGLRGPLPLAFSTITRPESGARCLNEKIQYDHDACVRFDETIQIAAKPLSICGNEGLLDAYETLKAKCDAYLTAFLGDPCVGPHASLLARKDWIQSNAYRSAIERGMSEDIARTSYLEGKVVRFRALDN